MQKLESRNMGFKLPLVCIFFCIIISICNNVESSPVRVITPIPKPTGEGINSTSKNASKTEDSSVTESPVLNDEDVTTQINILHASSSKDHENEIETQTASSVKVRVVEDKNVKNVTKTEMMIAEAVGKVNADNTTVLTESEDELIADALGIKRDGRAAAEAALISAAVAAPPPATDTTASSNDAPIRRHSFQPVDPFTASVNNLFGTLRRSLQNLLITGQLGLLKAIGSVDQTVATKQDGLQNATFTLVLEGQKATARLYDLTPQFVNRWIQRVGTTRDLKVFQQLNDVLNQYKSNSRNWYQAWYDHEIDWHNHFQNVWSNVNGHLRVPSLPKRPFGW